MTEQRRIDVLITQPPIINVALVEPRSELSVEMASVIVGPPGPKGERGDTTAAIRLITTPPLLITAGSCTLPCTPLGTVVWNMALVYLDLTPDDFDATGALRADRDYLVEDRFVRTEGDTIIFPNPVTADGLYAVVSYIAIAQA